MKHVTLRELAKKYAQGTIGLKAYREARANLIHDLLSGKTSLHPEDYSSLSSTYGDGDTTPPGGSEQTAKKKTEPAIDREPAPPSHAPASRFLAGAVALFVTLTILVSVLLFAGSDTADGPSTDHAGPGSATEVYDEIVRAKNLIRAFLRSNKWDKIQQDRFLSEWSSLKRDSLPEIERSIEFARLTNAIYKRLLEERALSGLGNSDAAIKKQRNLLNFARQLGIEDPRIMILHNPQSSAATTSTR